MFLGRFHHNLDEKGRLTVPARFRDLLVPDGAYIVQGFDHNLMVLPSSTFESLSHRINTMSITNPTARMLRRLLFSTADHVGVDKAGRILIPQFLRETANLQNRVMVIGNGEYFEIWSPEDWAAQNDELQEAQSNAQHFAALDLTSE